MLHLQRPQVYRPLTVLAWIRTNLFMKLPAHKSRHVSVRQGADSPTDAGRHRRAAAIIITYVGHNHKGHNFIGHNFIGHDLIVDDCIGLDYITKCVRGYARTCT